MNEPEQPKRRGRPPKKALAYAQNVALGMSKEQARDAAGYSSNSHTYDIETKKAVKYAIASVEKQREDLQTDPDFSFEGVAKRLVTRAKDKKVSPGVQTDNDKVLVSIMGFNAPTQVHTKSLGLIMEFSDLSGANLGALKDVLLTGKDE
jgi:hypothetical protein